jgi:hypothetical protein
LSDSVGSRRSSHEPSTILHEGETEESRPQHSAAISNDEYAGMSRAAERARARIHDGMTARDIHRIEVEERQLERIANGQRPRGRGRRHAPY